MTRLQAAGLTRQQALDALTPRPQRVAVLDPGARDRERDEDMLFVGMLILFMALVVYGQSVASSVAEEKSSRVIELLLTTLAPRRLLAGKVLGVGTLGVAQLAAVCVAGLTSAQIAGGEGLPPSAPETVALVVAGSSWASPSTASPTPPSARSCRARRTSKRRPRRSTSCSSAPTSAPWPRSQRPGRDVGADRRVPAAAGADGRPDARRARRHGRARAARRRRDRPARHLLLIRVAAGIYERSILRIGAPISLRSALPASLPRTAAAVPQVTR